jgi:hypothetical protein
MSRGRRTPPIVAMPPRDSDPSQDADFAFFSRNPGVMQYERDLIPGESPEPMPPGTRVAVIRIGEYRRARAFRPPPSEVN